MSIRFAIESVEGWLNGTSPRQACRPFTSPARTTYVDCNVCELECAAETVAAAARFVADNNSEEVPAAISWAWEAMNQSGGGTETFLIWLADQALPAALQHRAAAPFVRSWMP
jgi:hypothetical protein